MRISIILLLMVTFLFNSGKCLSNDSIAAVTLAGGIIKAKNVDSTKKYKRKDCPVCKGKGWYISGDKIEKVTCGYCEEEKGVAKSLPIPPLKQSSTDTRIIIRHK